LAGNDVTEGVLWTLVVERAIANWDTLSRSIWILAAAHFAFKSRGTARVHGAESATTTSFPAVSSARLLYSTERLFAAIFILATLEFLWVLAGGRIAPSRKARNAFQTFGAFVLRNISHDITFFALE
jgi:hypothetical protein